MKVKKPISFLCKLKKLPKSVSKKISTSIKDDNYYVKKIFSGLNRAILSNKSYTKNHAHLDSLSDLLYEFIYPDYKTKNVAFEKTLLLDYVRLGINEDCKFLLHRDGNTKFIKVFAQVGVIFKGDDKFTGEMNYSEAGGHKGLIGWLNEQGTILSGYKNEPRPKQPKAESKEIPF